MHNTNVPTDVELPSSNKLLKSTLIALIVAIVLLFTVILPAEYGVDPTGVGKMLGLTEMGEIKQQLANESEQDVQKPASELNSGIVVVEAPPVKINYVPTKVIPEAVAPAEVKPKEIIATETRTVELKPGDAAELKLGMQKGAVVTYQWFVDKGHVNYDTHADGEGISYHGYGKGRATTQDEGELVAAFDGMHGWYWRNRSSETVIVTLVVAGDYKGIERVL